MKMPEKIDPLYLATCGVNCLTCDRHLRARKACPGCLISEEGKQGHCRRCPVRQCARERGIVYCWTCEEYPCKELVALHKMYRTRYDVSLIKNSWQAKEVGVETFMEMERGRWTCKHCGGVVMQQNKRCNECRK